MNKSELKNIRATTTIGINRAKNEFAKKYLQHVKPEDSIKCMTELFNICRLWHSRELIKSAHNVIDELEQQKNN